MLLNFYDMSLNETILQYSLRLENYPDQWFRGIRVSKIFIQPDLGIWLKEVMMYIRCTVVRLHAI